MMLASSCKIIESWKEKPPSWRPRKLNTRAVPPERSDEAESAIAPYEFGDKKVVSLGRDV